MPNHTTATPYTSSAAFLERAEKMRQKLAQRDQDPDLDQKQSFSFAESTKAGRDYDLKVFKDLDRSRSATVEKVEVRSLAKEPDTDTFTQKQATFDHQDPDGLNSQIRGQYAKLLKQDPDFLLARSWRCHPAVLTAAIKRMGIEWVRKEIGFVAGKEKVRAKGKYLSTILAHNPY